jgi:Dyp-type peroxidase family
MDGTLRLDRVQGNIVPGFRTSYQAFLWLAFPSTVIARRWLAELVTEVASAAQVMTANQKRRGSGYAAGVVGGPLTTWVNVAFSRAGLERLGAGGVEEFSTAFKEGMAARAASVLRDPDPEGWLVGGHGSPEAHALLIVAANTSGELDAEIARQRRRCQRLGAGDLFVGPDGEPCRGETLPYRLRQHEHFGFRDGVSQPALNGSDGTMPGDFILGLQDGYGRTVRRGPDWARDGSYLVFRRLRQDVFGFRQAVRTGATAAGLAPDQFAAKLMGRWKSGARLGDPLEPWDPGFPAKETDAQYGHDEFALDPDGERIPRFAHVRKAYPRDVKAADRHRLLRRGIPYGPLLDERALADDGKERGLFFVAYQADIEAQFEHIQQRLSDPDFPGPLTGRDSVAGQPNAPHGLAVREPGGRTSVSLPFHSYVSMTGGGYFFSPSIPALNYLADPTVAWAERKSLMSTVSDERTRLGNFISEENPYPWPLNLPADFDQPGSPHVFRAGLGNHADQKTPFKFVDLERDDPRYLQGLFWSLGGDRTYRMSKAIRIEYDYTFPDGTRKTYAIMIGFEGGGGGM